MGYNKIPLALRYNDTTNNAEGLIEFQLNLSDVGNVCSATPSNGQGLVWSGGGDGSWCPSTLPTGGGGGGAVNSVNTQTGDVSLYLSSLSGVTFTNLGGATNEGDGLLPQHIQWNGSEWINQFEDEQYLRIRNETGLQLTQGQAVYISGVQGEVPLVGLADASDSTKMPCVGLIHETIDDERTGLAVTFGTGKLSTDIEGTVAIGKTAYVSPTTPGRLTVDKPNGATELIQNVGIVVRTNSGTQRVKVTSVGRSNDIPVNVDVVGSATIGTNEFTQTSAKLSNVDQNSVMITNSVSSASSVSGASGSLVYFEGTPPAPGLQNINTILTNAGINFESPSYFFALASGSHTIADETSAAIGWSTTGTGAITDPAGNITTDSGDTPSASIIDINTNGVYQVDCSVQGYEAVDRLGLVMDIHIDPGDGTFVAQTAYRTSNYTSRGSGNSELIHTGTCHMNILLSLSAGDRLAFFVKILTGPSGADLLQDGTYLRITKVG